MVLLLTNSIASERLTDAIRRASLALHEARNLASMLKDPRLDAIRSAAATLDEIAEEEAERAAGMECALSAEVKP